MTNYRYDLQKAIVDNGKKYGYEVPKELLIMKRGLTNFYKSYISK